MKVKRFVYTLANSIVPQHNYYHDLTKRPFGSSVAYFIIFILCSYYVFLGLSVVLTKGFLSERNLSASFIQSVENYPENLVISIRDGRLMTNHFRPYFLWVNDHDKKYLLAVIDETGEPQKIMKYNTYIMLTTQAFVMKRGNSFTSMPFGNTQVNLDKQTVVNIARQMKIALSCIKLLVVLFALIGMPLLLLVISSVYTLGVAGISYIIWKYSTAQKDARKVSFRRMHQLALHTITFPVILCYAMILAGGRMNNMHFTFLLIMLIFTNTAAYETFIDSPTKPQQR